MSAHLVLAAPIGSIIAWSDGSPRPPERFTKKLAAWKSGNSSGRLIRKQVEHAVGSVVLPANFTLHETDLGAGGVIAVRVQRTFSMNSDLRFTIVERPSAGMVRIFDRDGEDAELVHLAINRQAAQEWLSRQGYPRAVMSEVTADEAATETVEGRAA